jgi:hypothetical protein
MSSKAVGYENDGGAVVPELFGYPVQLLAFMLGKSCGGLIHDDDFGIGRQGLGNFDDLLLGYRKIAHPGSRGEVHIELIENPLRFLVHLPPVDAKPAISRFSWPMKIFSATLRSG